MDNEHLCETTVQGQCVACVKYNHHLTMLQQNNSVPDVLQSYSKSFRVKVLRHMTYNFGVFYASFFLIFDFYNAEFLQGND